MRIGGMIAAALIGKAFSDYSGLKGSDFDSMNQCTPQAPKPNKISQAKRRKYKRQGRV